MRTIKALACVAALAAGLATSVAQNVYSLNVVGYYNVPTPAGSYVMIANQLNTTNNTLAGLFPAPPPSSIFLKYAGGWTQYQFDPDDLVWLPDGAATVAVGEAGLFKAGSTTTLTFVGEVLQGNLSNPFAAAGVYAARASMVPQAGLVQTDLNLVGEPSDIVLKYAGGFTQYQFDPDDLVWLPEEPTFGVGEGMLVKKAGAATAWTRNFTVQ
jgi:hypothetical protein